VIPISQTLIRMIASASPAVGAPPPSTGNCCARFSFRKTIDYSLIPVAPGDPDALQVRRQGRPSAVGSLTEMGDPLPAVGASVRNGGDIEHQPRFAGVGPLAALHPVSR
jgi:hypothetical protein